MVGNRAWAGDSGFQRRHDGIDIVPGHALKGGCFRGGAIAVEFPSDLDPGLAGDFGEHFGIRSRLWKNRANFVGLDRLDNLRSVLHRRRSLRTQAEHRDRFETVFLAEIAEGGMSGNQFAVTPGNLGELFLGIGLHCGNALPGGLGPRFVGGFVGRITRRQGIGDDPGRTLHVVGALPPVWINPTTRMFRTAHKDGLIGRNLNRGHRPSHFDEGHSAAETVAQLVEVGFHALAGGEDNGRPPHRGDVFGGRRKMMQISARFENLDDFDVIATDLFHQIPHNGMERGDLETGVNPACQTREGDQQW